MVIRLDVYKRQALEGILFAAGEPVGVERLCLTLDVDRPTIDAVEMCIRDRNRPFHTTISPSMDILISSNLERLLFSLTRGETEEVSRYMDGLNRTGRYEVSDMVRSGIAKHFAAGYCDCLLYTARCV